MAYFTTPKLTQVQKVRALSPFIVRPPTAFEDVTPQEDSSAAIPAATFIDADYSVPPKGDSVTPSAPTLTSSAAIDVAPEAPPVKVEPPVSAADNPRLAPSSDAIDLSTAKAVQDELRCWDPMEDEWASGRNNYAVDVDNAAVAIDGFVAEQTPICKYYEVSRFIGAGELSSMGCFTSLLILIFSVSLIKPVLLTSRMEGSHGLIFYFLMFQLGTCRLNSCKDAHVDAGRRAESIGGMQVRPTNYVMPSGQRLGENPCPYATESPGGRFTLLEGQVYAVR